MPSGRTNKLPGYARLTEQLAVQALSVAFDAAPHRAREGETRWPIAEALPAARILLGDVRPDDAEVLRSATTALLKVIADPNGKVTDGFGHTRPVYALFALHLLGSASFIVKDDGVFGLVCRAGDLLWNILETKPASDPRLAVWHKLLLQEQGIDDEHDFPPGIDNLKMRFDSSDEPAPLVPLGLNDLIDSWTYYELVGLHGLHLVSMLEQDDAHTQRVRSAAEYHLGHTQPDYTTYQPWGLAAFAADPMTAVFAEQQLHDVATHLNIEGPGGAVMPALLLADNAALMSGTLSGIWRGQ